MQLKDSCIINHYEGIANLLEKLKNFKTMKKIEYIKIIDEHTALSLISSGFSYMEEYINGGQKIFVFEKSIAIEEKIGEIALRENKDLCLVQEGILRF